MKILILVLILATASRCLDASTPAPLEAAVTSTPSIEQQARELRGVQFNHFVPQRAKARWNQGEDPQPNEEPIVEEGSGTQELPAEEVVVEGDPNEDVGEGEGTEIGGDFGSQEGGEIGGEIGGEVADDKFQATIEAYWDLPWEEKSQNAEGLVANLKEFVASGQENLEISVTDLENIIIALSDHQHMLQAYQHAQRISNPEADFRGSGSDGQIYTSAVEVDAQGGYDNSGEEQGGNGEVQAAGQPSFDPEENQGPDDVPEIQYDESRRRVRKNVAAFGRSYSQRIQATYNRQGLFRPAANRRQAVRNPNQWPHNRWNQNHQQAIRFASRTPQAFHGNRWLDMQYSGNAAKFQHIPDLLVLVSGATTIYNTVFSPLPQNGTKSGSTLQDIVYYLQLYATVRNFAISFSSNRAGIENNLNQVMTNATALGFTKNEMLAFYGYLDLVNSLKLSTQAFTAPFIAQDQRFNIILTNFTATLQAIVQDIKFLMDQNEEVTKATKDLTSNDPDVANPTVANLERIDAALLLIPNLLTIYLNIQNALTDLKFQLNNLQAIRVEIQSVVTNMQLIVNGKADQVPAGSDRVMAAAVIALVYALIG